MRAVPTLESLELRYLDPVVECSRNVLVRIENQNIKSYLLGAPP